jgi:phosphoribosylaminoimidazolecarboxamide formyltransferase/IMP cyclohydrolase
MKVIISVSNKDKIVTFAEALHALGFELIATEGTARAIGERGIPVTTVSQFTGCPELLEGKVKTLHPRIHTAIATGEIGMVVVNLMPPGDETEKPLAKMDIGGVALLRAGIKNFELVAVITNPTQYDAVLGELRTGKELPRDTKLRLAKEAIQYLITYDSRIAMLLKRLV